MDHESMKKQSEVVRALRAELAATEKELADQKWVFEQFLKSPAWRLTAPVRWVVNQLRGRRNGHPEATTALPQQLNESAEAGIDDVELNASVTAQRRLSLGKFLTSRNTLEIPNSTNPVVSITLVLFNRAELTLACLRSIVETCNEEIEVVIVDNASSDETRQLLQRVTGARIHLNNENRHFLAGANQAAQECRGEYILFLNNDAQLLPNTLTNALRTIRSSSDIGAVGGKVIHHDWTLQEAGSIVWKDGSCSGYGRGDHPFEPMYTFRRDVDYCSGAFLLTPRKVWEQLRGFDTTFSPAYYEETDYCMRLWQRGLRVVFEPDAHILHYEFASSNSASAATSLQARNQKVFAERHRAALETHYQRSPERLVFARSRGAKGRILFIDDRVPHRWLGSGFPRANAFVHALTRLGYFVSIYPIDVINESWEAVYSDLPREAEVMVGMGRQMLKPFLRVRRDYYTTIVVSRPHNMELLSTTLSAHPEWFEDVDVIYDAEALSAQRTISLRKLSGNPMTDAEIRESVESEVRLTALADRVIAVSDSERKQFADHGISRVEVLGHCLEPKPGDTPFAAREGILFAGGVHRDISPNADALFWFLTEVFPVIRRQLGDIPFTIAGVNQSDRILELAKPPVRLMGHLPTLDDLYRSSRVFVAPTRYAAGIPHKIHEAAAHGLPVVATPLLAKQLGWTESELAIADSSEAFAAQCIDLYRNASRWTDLRNAALKRIGNECEPKQFEEKVRRILED
jgi:GT2 family glycosyltransferase/glycosyltransferase involved in cell wall biosynthesis